MNRTQALGTPGDQSRDASRLVAPRRLARSSNVQTPLALTAAANALGRPTPKLKASMGRMIAGLMVGMILGVVVALWARGTRQPRLEDGPEGATAAAARARDKGGLLTERVRTGPVARLLFRALERLYSLGFGRLVGHRFLRLTHRGRKSGRLYHTVLEVIRYEPTSSESVVLSGWGERADWYRNIRAAPAVEVVTAGHRYAPVQRPLESSELYAYLVGYVDRNGLIGRVARGTLGLRLDGSDADRATLDARGYRGVAFRPGP